MSVSHGRVRTEGPVQMVSTSSCVSVCLAGRDSFVMSTQTSVCPNPVRMEQTV